MFFAQRLSSQKQEGTEDETGQSGTQTGQPEAAHSQQQHHTHFLGDASHALPSFGSVNLRSAPLPEGFGVDDVRAFEKMYREHTEVCLSLIFRAYFFFFVGWCICRFEF